MKKEETQVNKEKKLARLLKRYFRLYSQEIITANPAFKNYENPGITKELNSLEGEIWALKREMGL